MADARVLYVHGAGPQPGATDLRAELDGVLFPHAQDVPTDIAWYGDVTDALRAAEDAGPGRGQGQAPTSSGPDPVAPMDHQAPPINESGRAPEDEAGLDDRLMARARVFWTETRQLAGRAIPGDGRGALLLRLVAAMGSLDDRLMPGPEDRHGTRTEAIGHFYRDVSGYLEDDRDVAPALRARVRAGIERNPGPLVVIAHSLGSVIAFDVLAEPGMAGRNVALITVGSPLGLGPLQDRLVAWAGSRPMAIPPSIRTWRNFHAHGDPVAQGSDLDAMLADFGPLGRLHSTPVRNELGWHHGFLGYLQAPEVQDAIYATLGVRRPGWP